ncbi:hypothetical protein ACLOJK_032261 [Asimina triloba]
MWVRISLFLPSDDDSNKGEPKREINVRRCEGFDCRLTDDKLLPPRLSTSTEERIEKSAPPSSFANNEGEKLWWILYGEAFGRPKVQSDFDNHGVNRLG